MGGAGLRWLGRVAIVAALLTVPAVPGFTADSGAAAKTKSSTSSSSTSGVSVWQSKSTQPHTSGSLWDRSVPAGGTSSGGYAKPAPAAANLNAPAAAKPAPTVTPTSGGYGKPAPSAAPANANIAPPPTNSAAPTSGGYAKPSIAGAAVASGAAVAATAATTTPANANVPTPANGNSPAPATAVPSSGGYTKPAIPSAPATALAPSPPPPPASGTLSSGGYAKPALAGTGAPTATGGGSGSGSGNGGPPTGQTPVSASAAKPPASALDRGAERQMATQSLARYKTEQARFAAPAQGTLTGASDYARNPLYANSAGQYKSYDQAYAERDVYRNSHPWAPPAYAYHSAPAFGMWDALFWWMVLDKITEPSHAAAAYNNANDPGFQAWRQEAQRQAVDNAELKAKLDAMDAKLASMQGQPRKPGTLPNGVPASVALAPEVAVAPRDKTTLVMGTGNPGGNYYPFCQGDQTMGGLRTHLQGFTIECRITNGSTENLEGLEDGTFDAIMVQSDVFGEWLARHPGVHLDALKATIYQEYVQVLANKKAKVERIGDLDASRHTIYLVGSGAQKTWDGFAAADPRYAAFETAGRLRRVPNDPGVLEVVAGNPDAVMVFVSGLKSELLREANDHFGDRLTMALVDDSRFQTILDATGHAVYAYAKVPSGVYPKLQRSRWFGLTSSVPSLTVAGLFILSDRWVAENGVASLGKVEDALWHTIPEIEKKVGAGS